MKSCSTTAALLLMSGRARPRCGRLREGCLSTVTNGCLFIHPYLGQRGGLDSVALGMADSPEESGGHLNFFNNRIEVGIHIGQCPGFLLEKEIRTNFAIVNPRAVKLAFEETNATTS